MSDVELCTDKHTFEQAEKVTDFAGFETLFAPLAHVDNPTLAAYQREKNQGKNPPLQGMYAVRYIEDQYGKKWQTPAEAAMSNIPAVDIKSTLQ